MNAKYLRNGNTIEYTNSGSASIEGGEIVKIGTNVAISGGTIAPGETGALHVSGVFEMPKDSAAIDVGDTLYLDEENENVTATQGSLTVTAGIAVAAAAAADTVVQVKLSGWA